MENKFTKTNEANILIKHKEMKNVAFDLLQKIEKKYKKKPQNIIESWSEIIGAKLAPLAKAVSFDKGVLTVKVTSSTLHSLLSSYEKEQLLKKLQKKFSKEVIQNIIFKIG